MNKRYDVFISYRRSSASEANLIAEKLRARGYRVFFDVEELRAGLFNEQLYRVIEQCKDFIVILPPQALDRCSDPEDWVRKEVCHAIAHRKNIIPVMLAGFEWPKVMPLQMESLCNYQAITASSHEFFDMAMDRLASDLKSKKYPKIRLIVRTMVTTLILLVMLCAIVYGAIRYYALPVERDTAEKLTMQIGILDFTMSMTHKIQQEWEEHRATDWSEMDRQTLQAVEYDHQQLLAYLENDIATQEQQHALFQVDLNNHEAFLLKCRGINSAELQGLSLSQQKILQQGKALIAQLAISLQDHTRKPSMDSRMNREIQIMFLLGESAYYEYLIALHDFSTKAQQCAWDFASEFQYMPTDCDLRSDLKTLTRKYNQVQNQLRDLNWKVKEETVEAMDQEAAAQRTLDSMKQQFVEQVEQRLAEMELEPADDQWTQWAKITTVAGYMHVFLEEQRNYPDEAPLISIDRLLTKIEQMLTVHAAHYPDAAAYTPAAGRFYQELAQGRQTSPGVMAIVFGEDPQYQTGDIVIERNQQPTPTIKAFERAIQLNKQGSVKFLRYQDDQFTTIETTVEAVGAKTGWVELIPNQQE